MGWATPGGGQDAQPKARKQEEGSARNGGEGSRERAAAARSRQTESYSTSNRQAHEHHPVQRATYPNSTAPPWLVYTEHTTLNATMREDGGERKRRAHSLRKPMARRGREALPKGREPEPREPRGGATGMATAQGAAHSGRGVRKQGFARRAIYVGGQRERDLLRTAHIDSHCSAVMVAEK